MNKVIVGAMLWVCCEWGTSQHWAWEWFVLVCSVTFCFAGVLGCSCMEGVCDAMPRLRVQLQECCQVDGATSQYVTTAQGACLHAQTTALYDGQMEQCIPPRSDVPVGKKAVNATVTVTDPLPTHYM